MQLFLTGFRLFKVIRRIPKLVCCKYGKASIKSKGTAACVPVTKINHDGGNALWLQVLVFALATCSLFATARGRPITKGACRPDQVTLWVKKNGTVTTSCFGCIECPDQYEPTIPCGSKVYFGKPSLACVICGNGTYSDSYDTGQCKPCSTCSATQNILRMCTKQRNTECECKPDHYWSEHVQDCIPCSWCCGDSKDDVMQDCVKQGMKTQKHCRPRLDCFPPKSTITTKSHLVKTSTITPALKSAPSSPAKTNGKHLLENSSILHQTDGPTATVAIRLLRTSPSLDRSVSIERTPKPKHIAVFVGTENAPVGEHPPKRGNDILANRSLIIPLITVLSFIAVTATVVAIYKHHLNWVLRTSTVPEISFGDQKGVLLKLKDLQRDKFEKLCKGLDKKIQGKRKYLEVAKCFGFPEEDLYKLDQDTSTKSSAELLCEWLEARYPNLTVFELINALRSKEIRRNDIQEILQGCILQTSKLN